MSERAGLVMVEKLPKAVANLSDVRRFVKRIEEAAALGHRAQQAQRATMRVVRRIRLEHQIRTLRLERGSLDLRVQAAVRREHQVEHIFGELIEGGRHGAPYRARAVPDENSGEYSGRWGGGGGRRIVTRPVPVHPGTARLLDVPRSRTPGHRAPPGRE